MSISPLRVLVSLVWVVLALAATAQEEPPVWSEENGPIAEKDTIVFQHLGDMPIDAVAMVIDSTGIIYGGGDGLFWMDSEVGEWIEEDLPFLIRLLALSPDTLFASLGSLRRSLDGGQTWTAMYDGGGGLYQAPFGPPFHGLLLTGNAISGDDPSFVRSTDRGDTWAFGSFVDIEPEDDNHSPEDFVALPVGHPHAGRIVSAGANGIAYSDDLGVTWQTSDLWWPLGYIGYSLGLTTSGRVLALVTDPTTFGYELFGSWDGIAWEHQGTFLDPTDEGSPGVSDFVGNPYGHALPDGSLFVMTGRGRFWRMTHPHGQAWEFLGRLTEDMLVNESLSWPNASIIGPDGHVYAGVSRSGTATAWAWKSTEPYPVASEDSSPVPHGDGSRLEVYPNPSTGQVEVALHLDATAGVRVSILDIRGRTVTELQEGPLLTGEHTFTWDGSGVAPGVYFIRAETEEETITRRVTIAR